MDSGASAEKIASDFSVALSNYIDQIRNAYNISTEHLIKFEVVQVDPYTFNVKVTIGPSVYIQPYIVGKNEEQFSKHLGLIYDSVKSKVSREEGINVIKGDIFYSPLNITPTSINIIFDIRFGPYIDAYFNDLLYRPDAVGKAGLSLPPGVNVNDYYVMMNMSFFKLMEYCKSPLYKAICDSDFFQYNYFMKHHTEYPDSQIDPLNPKVGQYLVSTNKYMQNGGIITEVVNKKIVYISYYNNNDYPGPTKLTIEHLRKESRLFKLYKKGYEEVIYNPATKRYSKIKKGVRDQENYIMIRTPALF